MIVLGLTGGIGSGKSTLAALLARRGAAVIDADAIAREVVQPGRPAYDGIVSHFGPAVVGADHTLDRPALAALVFADPAERAVLNRLTHPAIASEILRRLGQLAEEDDAAGTVMSVTVVDIPLLSAATRGQYRFGGVVVVDVPDEVALGRLVEQRGMTESDARARLAAQIPRPERLALADLVVDNQGTWAQLETAADRVWSWAQALAP